MTVEEMAGEYAEKTEAEYGFDMHPKTASFQGFIDGYSEALRWRDPKVEPPETGKPVLVKYRTAKDVEKYGIAKYFNLGIGNPWTIEGSTNRNVIGWRPIE